MSSVITISDSEFQSEVLQMTQPVLVYFWAPWCGPCRLMAPIMEDLAKSYDNQLKIVKMEVDPNPESVKTYKVEGVPALRLFLNGVVLESSEGALNKQKVEALLSPHLSG